MAKTPQQRYREATYNRAIAFAEAGRGSVEAMRRLIWLIEHGSTEDIQLKAAVHVLNWGIGRPTEHVQVDATHEVRDPSDTELARALIGRGYRIISGDLVNPEGSEKPN